MTWRDNARTVSTTQNYQITYYTKHEKLRYQTLRKLQWYDALYELIKLNLRQSWPHYDDTLTTGLYTTMTETRMNASHKSRQTERHLSLTRGDTCRTNHKSTGQFCINTPPRFETTLKTNKTMQTWQWAKAFYTQSKILKLNLCT